MQRLRSGLCLFYLLQQSALLAVPALGQNGLVAEGMVTPTNATTASEVVVVQMRTATEVPGPPVLVALDPPRLVLSAQATPSGAEPEMSFPQNVGRLAPGTWQVYGYGLDWRAPGGDPHFSGFSGPASFRVTPGEVHPQDLHPVAGQPVVLTVEGPWSSSCLPRIDQVSVAGQPPRVLIHAQRTDAGCPSTSAHPVPFEADVPVGPLPAGRYGIEVLVPTPDGERVEVYAAASMRVIPPGEPRLLDLSLEHDLDRDAHRLVALVEIPSKPSAGGCTSWEVAARNAWAHGRDLYAQFELEEIAAECGAAVTRTYLLPLPELETGLYRILAHREDRADAGSSTPHLSELWAQSPTLVEARKLAAVIAERFRVTVDWRDYQGRRGRATPISPAARPESADGQSAIFSFFDEDNWEVLVKVLSGCALNDHHWVFASASTDVEYTITVEDLVSGAQVRYHNDLGQASPAVTDTTALAGCE